MLLALKLMLAPALVVGATLATRRWGTRVGGILGGLPLVAGPVLLVYAIAHGQRFAAHAAAATLLGLVSLSCFVVAYALTPARGWLVRLLAGWGAVTLCTLILAGVSVAAPLALAAALASFAVARRLTRASARGARRVGSAPRSDLPVRALATAGLVLALTAMAADLGAQVSGLLAAFPVLASILAAFTHASAGAPAAVGLLRGLLAGCVGFGAFCFIVAVTLVALGLTAAFLLAGAVALAVQAVVLVSATERGGQEAVGRLLGELA